MTEQMTTDLQPASGPVDGHSLVTGQGKTSIADSVVEKIAGVAAREVSGVHEMGRGAARAFGTIKEKLPGGGAGPNVTQGVKVEVGERQAAIDIDLVVDYGVSIPDVSQAVRDNVIQRIERMTGLQVTEVNISVDDVYLGDDTTPEPPRVQ
ncbi:MAG: Asp23/Gls24 family envelope stress response protein [Acidimicrobiales bacterium]